MTKPANTSAEDHTWVYKICPSETWQQAQASGELSFSEDDQRDGYMHLSTESQVKGTLQKHFAGQEDLVLLALRVKDLPSDALRWEKSRGEQLFPHLYTALPSSAVATVVEIESAPASRSPKK